MEERQRQQSAIEKDMEAEGARAINLSRQVDGLQGLITKMEQDLKSAAKAAATASLQGAPAALGGKPNLGALKDPGPAQSGDRLCLRQRAVRPSG